MASACSFRVLLQVKPYERALGNDLELVEVGIVQGGAGQLAAQTAAPLAFRHFCVDQPHGLAAALILQERSSFLQRDLKLAFGLVVLDGITVHGTFVAPFACSCLRAFYANVSRGQVFIAAAASISLPQRCWTEPPIKCPPAPPIPAVPPRRPLSPATSRRGSPAGRLRLRWRKPRSSFFGALPCLQRRREQAGATFPENRTCSAPVP